MDSMGGNYLKNLEAKLSCKHFFVNSQGYASGRACIYCGLSIATVRYWINRRKSEVRKPDEKDIAS